MLRLSRKRPHKYHAKPQRIDGEFFASKKEATRWGELLLAYRAGEISGLRRQVSFPITINGVLVCRYVADFVYYDIRARRVVEDAKGVKTDIYRLKRKLMEVVNKIVIQEV